ncbi:unnamed protein product [Protopolystoma xenopodis]|uniref:Uncharacterized protein n=1 Tax=Protopolystoma xenopodis TaxID=117903 RepID=A0A448WEN0_9PLAT|nr:unnamed protein product [Protopolystoma xenopodis]
MRRLVSIIFFPFRSSFFFLSSSLSHFCILYHLLVLHLISFSSASTYSSPSFSSPHIPTITSFKRNFTSSSLSANSRISPILALCHAKTNHATMPESPHSAPSKADFSARPAQKFAALLSRLKMVRPAQSRFTGAYVAFDEVGLKAARRREPT